MASYLQLIRASSIQKSENLSRNKEPTRSSLAVELKAKLLLDEPAVPEENYRDETSPKEAGDLHDTSKKGATTQYHLLA